MNQRFVRCAHCGLPHDVAHVRCPSTGKVATRSRSRTGAIGASARPATADARPAAKPPPRHELVGAVVGRKYLLRRLLGAGGVGTVFEAEHLTIARSVAIKVLHGDHARKKESVLRFQREARAAGCIGHPNVCQVYDLDALGDGSPFLVMEMLYGETLAHRLAAIGRLPLYELIDILVQVLSALSAAHEKGIVHRDIKPENVFLTKPAGCAPIAKVLDFGVSKTVGAPRNPQDAEVDLTRKGMVMGTPYCMSPEQARGDRDLDARVDLYACGVMLYQALTGHRPFVAGDNQALLREVLRGKPRPARELRPALPPGFDDMLEKAMARDRENRYRSADEFRQELQLLRDSKAARERSPPLSASADADQHPTRAWPGAVAFADEAAATRLMRRPTKRDAGEDETILRPRPAS